MRQSKYTVDIQQASQVYDRLYNLAGLNGIDTENNWYLNARGMAKELADFYGISLRITVGVIAALAPLMAWDTKNSYPNLDNASRLIAGWQRGDSRELIFSRVTGFNTNKDKAIAILESGRVYKHLKGQKVTAFFYNIMRPWSDAKVTIDIWMIRAAFLTNLHQDFISRYTRVYDDFVAAIRIVARKYRVSGHAVQAAIWNFIRSIFDNGRGVALATP